MTWQETEKLYLEHLDDFRLLLGQGDDLAVFDIWVVRHRGHSWVESLSSMDALWAIPSAVAVALITEFWRKRLETEHDINFFRPISRLVNGEFKNQLGWGCSAYGDTFASLPSAIVAAVALLAKEKREARMQPQQHNESLCCALDSLVGMANRGETPWTSAAACAWRMATKAGHIVQRDGTWHVLHCSAAGDANAKEKREAEETETEDPPISPSLRAAERIVRMGKMGRSPEDEAAIGMVSAILDEELAKEKREAEEAKPRLSEAPANEQARQRLTDAIADRNKARSAYVMRGSYPIWDDDFPRVRAAKRIFALTSHPADRAERFVKDALAILDEALAEENHGYRLEFTDDMIFAIPPKVPYGKEAKPSSPAPMGTVRSARERDIEKVRQMATDFVNRLYDEVEGERAKP